MGDGCFSELEVLGITNGAGGESGLSESELEEEAEAHCGVGISYVAGSTLTGKG